MKDGEMRDKEVRVDVERQRDMYSYTEWYTAIETRDKTD